MKTAVGIMTEDAELFDDGNCVSLNYDRRKQHGCYFGTAVKNVPFWKELKKGVKIKIFYDELGNIHHVELKK